jgi:flagellar basal body-associated protein FliL
MMRAPLLAFVLAAPLAILAFAPGQAAEHGDKPQKAQKAPEHKTTQSESYIMVDPIYTTIVADNHVAGMLMIGAGLDVPNAQLREEVNRSLPVLRDAYIRNLMTFTANVVRTDTQPDVDLIASRLQAVTDRALKKKGAKLLLAQVAIRATSK